MKQLVFTIIGLLCSCIMMAQIGIGTENPSSGIEIEGSVRFRNLQEGDLQQFNREVLMDNQGRLGYLEIESERSYFVKMISDEMEDKVVLNQTDKSKDLFLEIELELLPRTISIFEIHYNVPVSFETEGYSAFSDTPLVSEIGVRLMKKEEQEGNYSNVAEGNRSLSIPSEYEKTYPNLEFRRSFIEGMNIQEVLNSDVHSKKITYKLMSYTKDNDGIVQYGSQMSDGRGEAGMLLIKVYHKPYYGETINE
ncbi:hypothetical protein C8P70_12259 [Myroides indicus]|uniref:Uncharacterized protein n=2 Tax=Myroides indicus TaxID=1323422 RepID=A0A4R7EV89_9FLAO|nr:hypothetical protein C8P70_12259 [Myroides indicus]